MTVTYNIIVQANPLPRAFNVTYSSLFPVSLHIGFVVVQFTDSEDDIRDHWPIACCELGKYDLRIYITKQIYIYLVGYLVLIDYFKGP